MFFQPLEYHSVYSAFKELNSSAFHSVIRLFEERSDDISKLPAEEAIEVKYLYCNALFETGKYDQHIAMCREVLEDIINYNHQYLNGQDLYYQCLTKLAQSYHHLADFEKADYIYQEILKIYPFDRDSVQKFYDNRLNQTPTFLSLAKAISITCIFLATFCIVIQLLVIKPFMWQWSRLFFYIWTGLTAVGVSVLGCAYFFFYLKNKTFVQKFLSESRKKLTRKRQN